MPIQITGRHLEVTPALKEYVAEKMNKLNNHFDHIIATRVILSVEKDNQCAEAVVNVPGTEFVAKAENFDMYCAIDMLEDKLDAQVRKHKQKLKDHRAERLKAEEVKTEEEAELIKEIDDFPSAEQYSDGTRG
ncbi:ribosome hibernation-promoting factor, HPF/YfiA family [Fangia hongkongensis]|nr:ribosome-associated translation inhibitor RaiA [Fangia hongkongensis]